MIARRRMLGAASFLMMAVGIFTFDASAVMAQGSCAPLLGPLIPSSPVEASYVDRYNGLVAKDSRSDRDDLVPDWTALLADLKRNGTVPIALIARTEGRLAIAMVQADDAKGGLPIIRQALAEIEQNHLIHTPLHADVLTQLAMAETDAGKAADAAGHADAAMTEAIAAFGARSWPAGQAARAASSAYAATGRYDDAEPLAARAEELALACLPASDPIIAHTMTSHAAIFGLSGRTGEAFAKAERAVSWVLAHNGERAPEMLSALDDLGWDLRNLGRIHEAETVLRRGVELAARYHPTSWERRAQLLGKLADVVEIEGQHQEAESLWLEASRYDRKVAGLGNPLIGSGELRRAASAAQARGDLPLALARREQAVALIASHAPSDHPELARARVEYASTLSIAGRTAEARAIADPAIAIVRAKLTSSNYLRMAIEVAYARIVAATDGAATAYPLAEPVARRMETVMLDAATSSGDLARLSALFTSSFATQTKLALATHREEEAFHELQLTNFSDLVIGNTDIAVRAAAANPAARDAVLRLQRDVQERQQLDRDRARAVHDVAKLVAIDGAIRDADARIATTTRELDRVFPAFRRLSRPAPVPLDTFRRRLRDDDILIAPFGLGGETVTVAVTRNGLTWASASVPGSRLIALIDRIGTSIAAGRRDNRKAFDVAAARELDQALMQPALEPLLRTHRHIMYYASGKLATVSPALLVEAPVRHGKTPAWLIRSHSISVVPTLDPPRVAADGRGFVGIGAPLLSGKLPRVYERGAAVGLTDFGTIATVLPSLPRAAVELRAMAASFPADGRRLLIGGAATERAVKALTVTSVEIVAIATHGLVRDALPGLIEPALVLTPPNSPDATDDGLLTASEIANLHLDADWVILSACNTADGPSPNDASYTGLARSFIEAGARALLVSHWAVRDDAAERLTVATVRAARSGADRATALQRAMLALMSDRSVSGAANPAVWAPFVLVE